MCKRVKRRIEVRRELLYQAYICDMDDKRIVCRPALCFVNERSSQRIQCVASKAIYRLRRKCDKPACSDDVRCELHIFWTGGKQQRLHVYSCFSFSA